MMSQRVVLYGKVKGLTVLKPKRKRVLIARISRMTQTRNRVIYPWPG
jgi:hypothetical protein